jgi:hypothetical protein
MLADDLDLDDPVQMSRQVHAQVATEADRCAPAERCRAPEPSSAAARRGAARTFLNQTQSSRGNASRDDLAGLDGNDNGLAGVRCVEVRHSVLAVVHRDDDPVELADPRHVCIVASPPDMPRAWTCRASRSAGTTSASRTAALPRVARRSSGRAGLSGAPGVAPRMIRISRRCARRRARDRRCRPSRRPRCT